METNNINNSETAAIEKTPNKTLEKPLDLYREYANIEAYVKIPFLIIGIGFLLHNVFLAGKSFDIDTYDRIMTIELSIVGIIVAVVFVMAGMAISKNSKLNKELKEIAKKHGIPKETMQNEFSALAIHYFGGRGVQLK